MVGALNVLSPRPYGFGEQQIATLALMAGVLGGALGHAQAFAERTRAEAEARAAAARLQAVLQAATEVAIVGLDLDRRVVFLDEGAERMLGYSGIEMIGGSPAIFFDAGEVERRAAERGSAPDAVQFAAVHHGSAAMDEWTLTRKDGSRLTVLLTTTGMYSPMARWPGSLGSPATSPSARRSRR